MNYLPLRLFCKGECHSEWRLVFAPSFSSSSKVHLLLLGLLVPSARMRGGGGGGEGRQSRHGDRGHSSSRYIRWYKEGEREIVGLVRAVSIFSLN